MPLRRAPGPEMVRRHGSIEACRLRGAHETQQLGGRELLVRGVEADACCQGSGPDGETGTGNLRMRAWLHRFAEAPPFWAGGWLPVRFRTTCYDKSRGDHQ